MLCWYVEWFRINLRNKHSKLISLLSRLLIYKEREIDKLIIFNFSESFRLFASFKNGPYAIYAAEDSFAEIYRSGASYKESAILKSQDTSYFVVKTTAGIFSINFCHDSQETWFLADEDPIYLLSNTSKCLLVVM